MQSLKTELSEVIYNAAEQAFEAKVTVHAQQGPVTYACAIPAPINTSFEDAAKILATEALRRHGGPVGLRSYTAKQTGQNAIRLVSNRLRRGLPLGQYGFFRGRAA